ncbi:MAG: hypothetical protein ACLFQM_06095 [Fidelibacterota bacterium]
MILQSAKIKGLILLVIIFAATVTAQEQVNLLTREYPEYRRFILDIPFNEGETYNSVIKPVISTMADSGEFSILITSQKARTFKGESLRKSEGNIPVRFTISYPDSNQILIQGKTIPFDKITSFYIIDENKYVFDIYEYSVDDNYYSNSVQLLNPEDQATKGAVSSEDTNLATSIVNKVRKARPENTTVNLLTKSLKTAGMILSGLIFLLFATYFIIKIYSGRNIFQDIAGMSQPGPGKEKPNKRPPQRKPSEYSRKQAQIDKQNQSAETDIYSYNTKRETPVINESAINSMLFDKKEKQIRKIMHQKKLNYNEAEMLFNLSHKS